MEQNEILPRCRKYTEINLCRQICSQFVIIQKAEENYF